MDRASFDRAAERTAGPYRILDRLTQREIEVSAEDFDDLAAMYRDFGTWQLEQMRNAIAEEKRTGRAANGEAVHYPAELYDRRLVLIDSLLAERAPGRD